MKKLIFLLLIVNTTIVKAQNAWTGVNNFSVTLSTDQTGMDLEAEKAAIRKVVLNETETYYKQDFEGWKNCFVNATYFRQYGYWEGYPDKVRYFDGFDTLAKVKVLQFKENRTYWKGSYEKQSNENFRIYNDIAWYTYEQESFDGKTHEFLGKSVELRILEKHNGEWKIAYLGYHYLPLEKKVHEGKEIQAVLKTDSLLNRAILNRDEKIAANLYTDNFLLTTASGRQKLKKDILDDIIHPALKFEINEMSEAKVMLNGNTAILTGVLHQKGIFSGEEFDNWLRVTDTWVSINGQWKIISGHASLISN